MKILATCIALAALVMAVSCSDDPVSPGTRTNLMTITVVDTAGNPVPGLNVGSINHSDYISRPVPPPLSLPSTQINFSIVSNDTVWLTVRDYFDQLVATLIDGVVYSAGSHTIDWNTDTVMSGFYYYHLVAGSYVADKWTVLDHGWDPTQTIIGQTDTDGRFATNDRLFFPCLLSDPPPIEIRDQFNTVTDTAFDFYNDTITFHLSDPAEPDSFYYYDRTVEPNQNVFQLIWEH